VTAKAAGTAQGDWRTSIGLRILFAILLVAAAGYVIWYHNHYYVWPGQPAGSRIAWCGHDYQAGGTGLTLRAVQSKAAGQVKDVGSYPLIGPRQPAYARGGSAGCPAAVFLETSPGRFTAYSLVSGQ
jgi:hypothetical protein